ncbi:MAG: (d)CMP kinase [bacterium]
MTGEARSFVVAIDGPAASGKSTTARAAAERLGFRYLDTGAMYRALTWKALASGVDPADRAALGALAERTRFALSPGPAGDRLLVDGEDVAERLRAPAVTRAVSLVASVPAVRRRLVGFQRELARGGPCVVEGRDIGTVVFPDAPVKIFLRASLEERARRRREELAGERPSVEDLAEEIRRRDAMDEGREDSPLRPAPDAIPLDTTGLTVEEVVEAIVRAVRAAAGRERPFR